MIRPAGVTLLPLLIGALWSGSAFAEAVDPPVHDCDRFAASSVEHPARAVGACKAAEQGNAEGQNWVGAMYAYGHGVPQDYAEAAKWFRKAAEQGLAAAQNWLGWLYEHGHGVPQDYAEAEEWYRKAAEQGVAEAQRALDTLLVRTGRSKPQQAEAETRS